MTAVRLFRGHGLGNDYLALDATEANVPPLTDEAVRRLCDRHTGVGGDGLLVLVRSADADAGVRIVNPDGSEAEKSGNGLRIFALFLLELGRAPIGEGFTVETEAGIVEMVIEAREGQGVVRVRVDMGAASFGAGAIGARGEERADGTLEVELDGGERVAGTPVSVGNPHFVIRTDDLRVDTLRRIGPRLSAAPAFSAGTNVQLARVVDRHTVEAMIWERGAGETLASGSSACAVALAAVRTGAADAGPVDVRMAGGTLTVDLSTPDRPVLLGPAAPVGWTDLHPGFVTALSACAGRPIRGDYPA